MSIQHEKRDECYSSVMSNVLLKAFFFYDEGVQEMHVQFFIDVSLADRVNVC